MRKFRFTPLTDNRGSIIVTILISTLALFIVTSSLVVLANSNLVRARNRVLLLQAQYAAESGADAAIAVFNNDLTTTYNGTGAAETTILNNGVYKSTFSTTVAAGSNGNERVITSTGRVYKPANAAQPTFKRKIEVIAQRTQGTLTSSSVVSRNVLDVQSGVKNIYGKDIYINGYINMNKSTTNLIAENITVVGKNTGVSNCSIGGSGNLVKPASFTTPGQTKTKITLGYNNCVNPPGNSSNANFDVLANQTNLTKVQSTYIPWSQYMDSSYQNSAGGCNDWTTGSFPRQIPSTGNTKKTHYPDSGTNISASCGSSGDLSLATGQYTINDNVHLRANMCATTACSPTFYNPNATIKYIFVEGSVNFDSVQTASGSGPLVLVSYGADPASKSASCPLGGSMYVGNGSTSAPALYFLATNGLCFDKTKFSADPAFGGMSGKNIYIASNPGTPKDLSLNSSFPDSSVPLDIAWHSARYRRL